MPFLPPNQQRQSTEGRFYISKATVNANMTWYVLFSVLLFLIVFIFITEQIALMMLMMAGTAGVDGGGASSCTHAGVAVL